MKKLVLISNIIVIFLLILFIASFFSLESELPLSELLLILLKKSPFALAGAVIVVLFQNWAMKKGKIISPTNNES